MKKVIVLVFMAMITSTFMGCQLLDSLFYKTEAIQADDLPSCSGDTPSNEDEALESVIFGLFTATAPTLDTLDNTTAAPDLFQAILSRVPGANVAYGRSIGFVRAIATTDTFENFFDDIETTGDGSLELTLTDEDFDTEFMTVNGSVAMVVNDFLPTSSKATATLEADVKAEIEAIPDTSFNGGKINLKMDIDASAGIVDEIVDNVEGYAAIAINTGVSLDETEYNKAGKYLINLKFTSQYDVNINDSSPTSSISAEIRLRVYNASNSLVGDYTYTDDEIEDMVTDLFE